MMHISKDHTERPFTFKDMKRESARCANYFRALGIKKGDRVMLILKRHYQFWFAILGLHKLGAVVIPATNQLLAHDIEYRFNAAGVNTIICTADGDTASQVEIAAEKCPQLVNKLIVNGEREGWRNFDEEYMLYSSHYNRTKDSPGGDDRELRAILKLPHITINILSVIYIQQNTGTMLTRTDFTLPFPTPAGQNQCGVSCTVSGFVRQQPLYMTLTGLTRRTLCQCLLNIKLQPSVHRRQCSE